MISSCLKVQVNNDPFCILSFTGASLDYAVESEGNINDLIVLSHLRNFFFVHSQWAFSAPMSSTTGTFPSFIVGYTVDAENLSGHPDSLSFACFTQQSLKDDLSKNPPPMGDSFTMSEDEWRALIQSTSFENLNSVLTEASGDNAVPTIVESTKLKIMRCTSADMLTLPPRDSESAPYKDAFDLVKDKLTNKVGVLDSNGLAPAVYYADGDYIEFNADCSIQSPIIVPNVDSPTTPT